MPPYVSSLAIPSLSAAGEILPRLLTVLVFTPNDGVMLLVQLDPARMGSLSYYLPILLLDEGEEDPLGVDATAAVDDGGMET
jgi:hypothetical protein